MPLPAPLTVVGGFLGAGKTTFVNHLLRDANGVRFAVLVNDFGDLAIDEDLILSHDGQTIALANGCICCTIGNDLIETVTDLMESENPPEHLIIEASGVADPGPVAEIGSLDPNLSRDLTVVVIDVDQIRAHHEDEKLTDTVERQIRAADLFVLNRVDTPSEDTLRQTTAWLAQRNPAANFIKTSNGGVPLALLTGTDQGLDQTRKSTTIKHASDSSDHATKFTTRILEIEPGTARQAFVKRMNDLPANVLRGKGHIDLEGQTYEFQKAGRRQSLRKAEPSSTCNLGKIVLIEANAQPGDRK